MLKQKRAGGVRSRAEAWRVFQRPLTNWPGGARSPEVPVLSAEEPPRTPLRCDPHLVVLSAASARLPTPAAFNLVLTIQDAGKVSVNYLKASFEQFQVEAVKKPTDNARTSTAVTI